MSDKSTEERLREVEEENEAIKDFLAKYVGKGPSRRQVLKSGATAAGAGMLGFGAGNASAQASTSDSDGNVGGPNNRIDVFSDGVDANSVNTGEQNNNEVNLTKLVNDGTYADILDAVVNEPANHAERKRFIIEPGTYQVSTQYTLLESNFEVVAYGAGHMWNESRVAPVVIEWTGTTGGGETMLTIGDNATRVEGVEFEGVEFAPGTNGDAVTGIHFGGGSTAATRDIRFEKCRFSSFGANPITVNTEVNNFDHKFIDCSWAGNLNKAQLGNQAEIRGGYLLTQDGNTGLDVGNKSSVVGLSADIKGASIGLEVGAMCLVAPDNLEGRGTTGSIGVKQTRGTGSNPSRFVGSIGSVDIGYQLTTGAVVGMGSMTNIGSYKWDFQGGNFDHRALILTDASPAEINFASETQQELLILSAHPLTNVAAADLVPGFVGFDSSRGGTGTPAMVYDGGDHISPSYWDRDGTL